MPASFASAALDLVGHVAAQQTVTGVWAALQVAADQFGFGLACILPGNRSLETTTFASTLPSGLLVNYDANGYHTTDPLITLSMGLRRPPRGN
jgi:hypothetical protein